jgi:hypothetical protein
VVGVGVGSYVLFMMLGLILLCLTEALDSKPKHSLNAPGVRMSFVTKELYQGSTQTLYPDDLGHAFSLFRAWDRHLKLQGMTPIYAEDSASVGPILLNPAGTRQYYQYGYDERGNLELQIWRQVVSAPRLPKASDEAGRRATEQL